MFARMAFLMVLIAMTAPVSGQEKSGPEHLSEAQLIESLEIPSGRTSAAFMFKRLGERGNFNYWIVERDTTGQVEQHADWTDVFIVQSGKGSVLYGGQLTGARENAPGEMLCWEITGGTRHPLAQNDMMIIPAGMPHQVWVEPGESIRYVIVKIKRITP